MLTETVLAVIRPAVAVERTAGAEIIVPAGAGVLTRALEFHMLTAHVARDAVFVVLIVEPLAELVAMLFEATLLARTATVLLIADVVAVGPEVVILPVEYLILAQLAVKGTVEQGNTHAGL